MGDVNVLMYLMDSQKVLFAQLNEKFKYLHKWRIETMSRERDE